jgi:predicted nucleic acid-binding protein
VRRFDLKLRAPDALHLAICRRLQARLVTLDNNLARAARALDVPCINPAETSAL